MRTTIKGFDAMMRLMRVRMVLVRVLSVPGLMAAMALALTGPTLAQQNAFAAAITVNGRVISNYELAQRTILFGLLQPGIDATLEARKSLIDDRLRQQGAEALGIEISPEAVLTGMTEFAGRANLTAEEFSAAIGERGVAPETFRDFVQAGLMWREVVRTRFLPVTKVSEREIDRAIAGGTGSGSELKLLLSEIVIPTGSATDALELALRIKGDGPSPSAFAAAARVHSVAPSAPQGGALDWALLSSLPPQIAARVAGLEIGQVSDPIPLSGSVMLLMVRDRSGAGAMDAQGRPQRANGAMQVDFVRLTLGGQTDGAALRAGADRCEDLLGSTRGLPEEAVLRQTLVESALDGATAAALAGLDAGETAVVSNASGQSVLMMLCSRGPASAFAASREDVRGQLLNQKMALRAQNYLEKLRTEAHITEP